MMTPDQFDKWLSTPCLGRKVNYYTGDLGRDRPNSGRLRMHKYNGFETDVDEMISRACKNARTSPDALTRLATKAWLAGEVDGGVHLLQRRLGDHRYEYWAVRR